jgi:ribonucleoside-diphosphate reductase alpha chain
MGKATGLRITRLFTKPGEDPLDSVAWGKRDSRITNPDGSIVFEMKDAEVPASWSQVAVDILVSKYLRKAGVPQLDEAGEPLPNEEGRVVLGPERSARQVIRRLTSTWRWWGEHHGYFASEADARAFEDELAYMLVHQMGAPNSPQWFNTGLHHAYGLTGPAQGFWYVDPATGRAVPSPDSYSRPAPHACFIQSIEDDLVNEGGIMDLWVREARLFKFGAGTGTNFSKIRAENEPLSGGGRSSGVMSFLKIGDRAAGAIKSGGTTRRAAKMVILDIDHPDVQEFIQWKKGEEEKVRTLIAAGYSADFNGEAYQTIAGQNANNSVRVSNDFIRAVLDNADWDLTARTDGRVMRTVPARQLWQEIAEAAWACADPGLQFDGTINEWHTCPAAGRIRASNPCSEYMFLDNTACNLASLNLGSFFDDDSGTFNIEAYQHAVRLWTIVLEISVTMAHFPSREIAQGSYDYRTLGLGYANLGSLLMRSGIAYDSDEGRAIAAALTALLTGISYATSAEMASVLGPFPRFAENREAMLRVIRNHRRAAYDAPPEEYEGISHQVVGIDPRRCPAALLEAARRAWDSALEMGEQHGYRNAQTTCLAPTGCLVGGSLVPTSRGLVRLRSLGDPHGPQWQDLDLQVATDRGTRAATQFYVNGIEPVVGVTTQRGYHIQGTPTHRVRVVEADGRWVWKRFADLRPGDLVPLALGNLIGRPQTVLLPPKPEVHWTGDFITAVPREMTAELAELVGYFMGSGSLHAKGLRLTVSVADLDVAERLRILAKELFALEAAVKERKGYTEISLDSVPLALWWEACGFAKHSPSAQRSVRGYRPHIPDAILHSNDPEVYAAFLRGLFEADGTVRAGYPTWSTGDPEFSQDVQTLLLALGFPTTRKLDRSGWGDSDLAVLRLLSVSSAADWLDRVGFIGMRKAAAVRTGEGGYASRKDHIPVSRDLIDRLAPANDALRRRMLLSMSRLGLISRRSASELLERSPDPELEHLLSFFYDRVAAANLDEEQPTYDLSVPDEVTYVANGFVSHNTIGLQMDCDTTGVEPDFALVKFKKLAGGGYFKIANQSIEPALRSLDYPAEERAEMVRYVVGSMTLVGAPHVDRETLTSLGLTDREVDAVERALPGVFELRHAFSPYVIGEQALARLGIDETVWKAAGFDLLRHFGFTEEQIREAGDHICGRQTIEGAPHLRPEHLPVFDTANRNGRYGTRFIHYTGHIKAMAAVQPFITGAISKTINMPNEATIAEIQEAYMLSWQLGLKAMALYRDGSKASQPLSVTSDEGHSPDEEPVEVSDALETTARVIGGYFAPGVSPSQAYKGVVRPLFTLPSRRRGWTQEARVGGHKIFLRTGEYEDGTLGELFIDLAKEGATLRGILSCFAIAVSKGLQYGVPLEEFVDTFTFHTFEPRGLVEGHPNIKMANSIIDYVFRALGLEYLSRTDLVQVPPTGERELPEPPKGLAVDAGLQLELGEATQAEPGSAARPMPINRPAAKVGRPPGGNGHGRPAPVAVPAPGGDAARAQTMSVQGALGSLMGGAPLCDVCGHITVRNGSCYKCLNCGNSMGCS